MEVKILAETRNRKHSRELFKILRENYEDVQVLGFYDSPEDYVAGNLQSQAFEHVEEEEPFEGDMNKQYNTELIDEEYSESEDYSLSPDDADDVRIVPDNKKSFDKQSVSAASSSEKMMRRQSRNY